jgi:hypothetical protein
MGEFLEVMTSTLQRIELEHAESGRNSPQQVPFALVATAYRRKRLLEGILSSDKSVQKALQQMNEQQAMDLMMKKMKEGAADGRAGQGRAGQGRGI